MSELTGVRRLAEWVLGFAAQDVSPELLRRASLLVLDAIGCALAALDEPACQAVIREAERLGGAPECAIIGSAVRVAAPQAVLANGALIRCLDLNDCYWGPVRRGAHPSDNIPAALACAEQAGASGRELLAAIILGYELDGRMVDIVADEGHWDYVSRSRIMVPAMATRLLGLDANQAAAALALSIAQGPSLLAIREGQISAAKWLAGALVAHSSLVALRLAAAGLSGPPGALEGRHGWLEAVMPELDLDGLTAPFITPARIEYVSVNAYPCLATAQASVSAAIQANHWIAGRLDQLESVRLRLPDVPMTAQHLQAGARRYPETRETADHSFRFVVAAGLMDGELTARQYAHDRWLDPATRELMDRLEIVPDERLNGSWPEGYPCVFELALRSGERQRIEMPFSPGHHLRDEQMVLDKFRQNASPHVNPDEVIDAVLGLARQSTVKPLMRLLAKL